MYNPNLPSGNPERSKAAVEAGGEPGGGAGEVTDVDVSALGAFILETVISKQKKDAIASRLAAMALTR